MKILFLGDYSNLHACLASSLRMRGHEVTVVSDGGRYMDTSADILLDRRLGRFGSLKYMYDVISLIPKIRDYDVVQLINPHFLLLRPDKIKYFFDIIRRQNRSVFLTLAGNDYFFVKACMDGRTFRFSEFMTGDKPTEFEQATHYGERWLTSEIRKFTEYIYSNIDGAMSVLPEYDIAARPVLGEKLAFTNIPVDLSYLPYKGIGKDDPVRLFIGMMRRRELQKGTSRLLEICRKIENEMHGKCRVECVSGLPLKEYLTRMADSHIVLDQLYSYSPGTNGFQAMALGKVAATGGQDEFYDYIGEKESRPIFSLSPLDNDIEDKLRTLIPDRDRMIEMGRKGREMVARHNAVDVVASKFENHWNKIISKK